MKVDALYEYDYVSFHAVLHRFFYAPDDQPKKTKIVRRNMMCKENRIILIHIKHRMCNKRLPVSK